MISLLKGRRTHARLRNKQGFTLVELVLVIAIIGIVFGLVLTRSSSYQFWKQDAAIRKISELIRFLHYQAIADNMYYQLEIDLNNADHNYRDAYRVGVLHEIDSATPPPGADSYNEPLIILELNAFLHPSVGESYIMSPPEEYPALYEWEVLPEEFKISWVRTMRGDRTRNEGGKVYIQFSPRGYSEFAVLHLSLTNDSPRTIVINPFTGLTEIYNDHREFEWTYQKK